MVHRIPFEARPWIDGATYDRLARPSTLHYDLYALSDGFAYYFRVEARQGGHALQGRSVYAYDAATETLTEVREPEGATQVAWTRRNRHVFQAVHKRLLGVCRMLSGYVRVSVLCHYVNVPDQNPWPRNMVNTYRYTIKPDDPRFGPRKGDAKRGGRPKVSRLPDLL